MATHPIRFRLPVDHSTEIGRIIQHWAFLEWRVRSIAYSLLDLDPKRGRVAVREPRITEYITMIEDLCQLRSIRIGFNTKDLKKNLESLAFFRNALAHGIWVKHADTKNPVLQIVAGSYPPAPGKPSIKARINPQGLEMDIDNLKGIGDKIGGAIVEIGKLKIEIDAKLQPTESGF